MSGKEIILIATSLFTIISCQPSDKKQNNKAEEINLQSTASGAITEWTYLFDGTSIDAWKGWKKSNVGAAWSINDAGELSFDPTVEDRGDIITRAVFQDFEFQLEWKISKCGNSGIMYNVQESEKYSAPYSTGPEMQILDNDCHPDGKIDTHRAGDLYDMIETNVVNVKEPGEWNNIIIKSKDANYEFWQNGEMVVEFQMHTPLWDEMVAGSKFNGWEGFGEYKSGHIALQDHGDKIWFRNIRIREL